MDHLINFLCVWTCFTALFAKGHTIKGMFFTRKYFWLTIITWLYLIWGISSLINLIRLL